MISDQNYFAYQKSLIEYSMDLFTSRDCRFSANFISGHTPSPGGEGRGGAKKMNFGMVIKSSPGGEGRGGAKKMNFWMCIKSSPGGEGRGGAKK